MFIGMIYVGMPYERRGRPLVRVANSIRASLTTDAASPTFIATACTAAEAFVGVDVGAPHQHRWAGAGQMPDAA